MSVSLTGSLFLVTNIFSRFSISGDAFVGGFLARYVMGDSLPDCVETAKRVARLIIGRSGCTYPDQVPEDIMVGADCGC